MVFLLSLWMFVYLTIFLISIFLALQWTSILTVLPGSQTLSIKEETHDVKTFGFNAPRRPDGSPFCEAGQFASFDFPRPNGETLNRTWTISSPPSEIAETGRFTISVKKVGHCL